MGSHIDPQVPSASSNPGSLAAVAGRELNAGRDLRRVMGIERIGAAIRGARGDPEFMPVGPERRRLRSLLTIWFVIIPVLVVLFDLLRRLLAGLLSLDQLRQIATTVLSERGIGSFGMPIWINFAPISLLGVALVLALIVEVLSHVGRGPAVQRGIYRAVMGSIILAMLSILLTMVWVAGTNQTWLWVIAFTCFLAAAAGFLIYLFVNNVRSVPRSFVDYVIAIAVFVASTLIAFSMVLGLDALDEERPDGGAEAKDVVVETIGDDGSATNDLANSSETLDQGVMLGTNGQEGGERDSEPGGTDTAENTSWDVVGFFPVIAIVATATMWMYHSFQRWRSNGRVHETQLRSLAKRTMRTLGLEDAGLLEKLSRKIGKRLGPSLSRSPVMEYSAYICNASGGAVTEVSKAAKRIDTGVTEAAISAGIKAVFEWMGDGKQEWSSACYQFLFVQVSIGVASNLYDTEVKRQKQWPFVVDADILACSRLLAVCVAEAIYKAKLHQLAPLPQRPSSCRGANGRDGPSD